MINENNDAFIVRIQQNTQLFAYPDKVNHFELRKTVPKLYLDKIAVEEYDGFDFGDRDCLVIFPFEAVLQVIYYNAEAAF